MLLSHTPPPGARARAMPPARPSVPSRLSPGALPEEEEDRGGAALVAGATAEGPLGSRSSMPSPPALPSGFQLLKQIKLVRPPLPGRFSSGDVIAPSVQ